MSVSLPDHSRQQQQLQLLQLQNAWLERILSGGRGEAGSLESLCREAEQLVPGACACVMRLVDNDRLSVAAAPSLPEALREAYENSSLGGAAGSCAVAVLEGSASLIEDAWRDPRWSSRRELAEAHDIRASWSQPVMMDGALVSGSFTLMLPRPGLPDEFQQSVLQVCANLTALLWRHQAHTRQMWHLAHHDRLTGLPNRDYLDAELERAIQASDRLDRPFALMYIDLDNFKDINDSFGHDFGDRVLLEALRRIRACLREGDMIFRHGGDEFLLILENLEDALAVDAIARKLIAAFAAPLRIDEQTVTARFSIGVSLYPQDADNAQDLLKHADIAMYQAKAGGKNDVHFFEPALARRIQRRMQMEQEIRRGLQRDEFELYFQPQYLADSDEMVSLEALLRWNHPERGLVLPGEFIPVAEKSSLIRELSLLVFHELCRIGRIWLDRGYEIPRLAVNMSTAQLTEACNDRLQMLLEKTGMHADRIEIEVTETLVMNRGDSGIRELQKMRDHGILLALDDFGTGYSSLSQLKKMPIHKLKIDRSFVMDLEQDEDDRVIVRTIIAMGRNLGLEIVAEGVETAFQQQFLLDNGCDYIQGFYRARPMPVEQVEKLLFRSES